MPKDTSCGAFPTHQAWQQKVAGNAQFLVHFIQFGKILWKALAVIESVYWSVRSQWRQGGGRIGTWNGFAHGKCDISADRGAIRYVRRYSKVIFRFCETKILFYQLI